MRKKIEVFLVDGYRFIVNNRCDYMGENYPEDDWIVIVIKEDIEELKLEAAQKMAETGIIPYSKSLDKIVYIEYNDRYSIDNKFVVSEEECSKEEASKVFYEIIESELYKELTEKFKKEDEEKKLKKEQHEEEIIQLREKKLLEELKKKYEN